VGGDRGFVAPFVDQPSDRVVDLNRLEHTDPALVAGLAALGAAARL
jgi:hypothetical protein